MCDTLIVTFSNMAANDQATVNPRASFMSAVWKNYGFPAKDGTTHKSKTIRKIVLSNFQVLCRLNFKNECTLKTSTQH